MKIKIHSAVALALIVVLGGMCHGIVADSERIKGRESLKPIPISIKKDRPDAFALTERPMADAQLQSSAYGTQIYYRNGSVAQGQLAELFYSNPSYYECGYTYTAVLYPLSGDPDLYLHERVGGTWKKLKQSLNSGTATDTFTFTCDDITDTATNVDLDAKGYTAATYEFFLYKAEGGNAAARFMAFPLHNGQTAYTATINAVLDHSMSSGGNCPDYRVLSYTNELAEDQYGLSAFSTPNLCSSADALYGFKNSSGTRFSINGQYNTSSGNEGGYYLFYDGHTGYDYPATNGTAVYPVAAGTAYIDNGNDVKVVHSNGYTSYYLHLSSENIYDGQPVTTSTNIGAVGQGHLHLTIKKGTQRVDPYGWKGPAGQDPLKVDGADNVCLWNTCS
jgi:murein DD-endopeptidase MepM/ murein hydrolase activator NlpD